MRKGIGYVVMMAIVVASLAGCGETNVEKDFATEVTNNTQEENITEQLSEKLEEADNKQELNGLQLPGYSFTRENFPKMDGSTSLVPLGKALAGALLGETKESVENLVAFNKTTQSYRNLMNGECDLILGSWPNEVIFDEMKENNFECQMEEISTEALIFVVNEKNPINNLTTEQIKGIYSGKITNWSEVGGKDEPIEAFQRNAGSGSQALMEKLIMKDTQMKNAPESYMIGSMGELMDAVKNYDNSATALGYSVYYYANDMKMADGLKIISVDDVEPNADTIRQKKYPHTNAYYCAIDGKSAADSPQRIIYDWLVGEEGQKLVASEGYVSILDTGIKGKQDPLVTNRFTRLTDEFIADLKADNSYGHIYPFVGEVLYSVGEDGYSSVAGMMRGLMDENGRIVADPTYTACTPLYYMDDTVHVLPFWLLERVVEGKTAEESTTVYGVASMDGKIVTECKYQSVQPGGDGILLKESYESKSFVLLDYEGKELLTDKDLQLSGNECYVAMSNGESILTICDGGEKYYFTDLNGKKIIDGTYSYASNFSRGRAVVGIGEKYGVIDKKGKIIVPMKYSWATIDRDYIIAEDENGECIFNQDGKQLATAFDGIYFVIDDDGNYCGVPGDECPDETFYYKKDGSVAYSYVPDKEVKIGGNALFMTMGNNSIRIEDKLSGETKEFSGYEDACGLPCYSLDKEGMQGCSMDNPYLNVYSYTKEDNKAMLIDKKLNSYMEIEGSFSCVKDVVKNQNYIAAYIYDENMYHLYNEDMKELCVSQYLPRVHNGLIEIYNDYSTSYIDLNGKIVFCYSLSNSLAD